MIIRTNATTIPRDKLRKYPLSSLKRCERLERVITLALLGSFTAVPGDKKSVKVHGLVFWNKRHLAGESTEMLEEELPPTLDGVMM